MIPSAELNMVVNQNKKIHPHKFTLWVGIGSIIMMFAGLTSAYIVKREQPGWTSYTTPIAFYYSTAVILISSVTIYLAGKSFAERRMVRYKKLVAATAILGLLFMLLQWLGFSSFMGNRNHAARVGCGSVFVCYCRIACGACIGRGDRPGYIIPEGKKYSDPEL